MSKHLLESDAGVRIAPLSALSDFQVAEGYRDIRGWHVLSSDGQDVGKVHDLLVDLDGMRTRYLDVRLHSTFAAADVDRDVLVPIGSAETDEGRSAVIVGIPADRISLLPAFDHRTLHRGFESEIRRHFSLAEAATAGGAATGAAFYDNAGYDDGRFFSRREAPLADRAEPAETRIPVNPEDTVTMRRGEDGHDEVIVRRPVEP
jgi:sporulation protein YlmC with PRC-barrel domain